MGNKFTLFSFLFQEGYREMPRGITYYLFVLLSVVISVFELWLGSVGNLSPYHYSVIFLTALLPVAFLTCRASKTSTPRPSVIDYICALLILSAGLHLMLQMDMLLTRISGVDPLTTLDMISAFIFVFGTLELCRRTLGFGMTLVLLAGLGYAFFGHLIAGAFGHRQLSYDTIFEEMVYTTNGIFGSPVQVAATYAFLFIMFGHFFTKAGAGQFIFDIAASFVGSRVGGLAKVAVTTAAAFGSISGSPSSDVATTGSINIPMMKKRGYHPVFAGAVESASATGGTMLPPIMGSVAFLMAEFTGIAYVDIALASVLSAVLYYMGVYFQVHFRSLKENFVGMNDKDIPQIWPIFFKGFYYIFPVVVLIWAMEQGFTPSLAACYGIAAVFAISFFRRSTWIKLKDLIEIFIGVVYSIAPLTVATAAAGIIIGVINLTGMAGKFTSLIFTLTQGNVLGSLMVGAFICIILGMGMPTPSVYVLVAALVAPALLELKLQLLPTHLFLLFFSALSAITPPVGVAAYTAAGIAAANPIAIGVQATKLAAVGFIIPFMFIYQPSLLLQGSFFEIAFAAVTALIGVYFLAASMEGYLRNRLRLRERTVMFIAAISMIYPDIVINIVSGIVLLYFYFSGFRKNPKSVGAKAETANMKN